MIFRKIKPSVWVCYALFFAGWMIHPTKTRANDASVITDVTWARGTDGTSLIATLVLSEMCSPDRIRLLFDVDGPAKGEARMGADMMVEGPHVYQHTGEGDWTWKQLGVVPAHIASNRISLRIASFPDAALVRAVAELTNEDWTTQNRLPDHGELSFVVSELPSSDWAELTGQPVDPSLHIQSVEPFRTVSGGLGFRVAVVGNPDVSKIRIMIDTNLSTSGWSDFGIDVMSEGALMFQYPSGEKEWRWEGLGEVISTVQSNAVLLILPGVAPSGSFRWYAESITPNWEVIKRYPARGVITNDASSLASAPAVLEPPPVDIAELLAFMPVTLSRRIQDDVLSKTWKSVDAKTPLPQVTIPGYAQAAPVFVEITDARTGTRQTLVPDLVEESDNMLKWSGRIDETTTWFLAHSPSAAGELDLIGAVASSEEHCFRLSVGLTYPDASWTWHDDMSFSAVMNGQRKYVHDYASPYGITQRRSYYPFAVISTPEAMVLAETDGREPRQFQIEALSAERKLAVHYDMATTPLTGHFPGLATFHVRFRAEVRTGTGADPFRSALQSWYDRDPDWYEAHAPKHGLWLPFTDINTINGFEDFHFAFFEKVGAFGKDVDTANASGVLNFPYIEPWLYWLPINDPSKWNKTSAVERMQMLAKNSTGKERDFASSGYLGASRDASLNHRITFLNTPWSNGGRMEVNTDPELPVTKQLSVNRAMAEWRYIQSVITDPRIDGIYLDSMSAMETIDYNPAALEVADYPATFVMADLKPGLAMPVQAVEFTAALGRYLKAHGKYLMGNFPCWKFPFFMPYIDVPGEETTWYSGNQFTPLSGRELNYRRAISGAKPFGFLQATHFDSLTRSDMEKYFRECLFFAFMPSFFSHDGANDPYWVDAAMYERDRPLFLKYLPLTIRLSEAGWRPVPAARTDETSVRVEQFGKSTDDVLFLTVRNTIDAEAQTLLHLSEELGPRVIYDVFSGKIDQLNSDHRSTELFMSPSDITCLVIIRPEVLSMEESIQARWVSNNIIYRAASRNLTSLKQELDIGIVCDVRQEVAAVGDDPVSLRLMVENKRAEPITIRNVSGTKDRHQVEPDQSYVIELPKVASRGEDGWMRVRWDVEAGEKIRTMERLLHPKTIEPYAITAPTTRMQSEKDVVQLEYVVTGRQAKPSHVTLRWKSDTDEGSETRDVAFDQPAFFRLDIEKKNRTVQTVKVELLVDQHVINEYTTHVVFAPMLQHQGMNPEHRITADSAYSGYTVEVLRDGVFETAGLNWNEGAFASADTTEPHWVRYELRNPAVLSSVTIHWNREGGVTYTSRCGEVWVTPEGGEPVKVGEFTNTVATAKTIVNITPVMAKSLELRQPSSCGSSERPGILWISELEIE